jgi:Protein of unknown function (DUF2848)
MNSFGVAVSLGMTKLRFLLDDSPSDFGVERVLIAGYTGRDATKVRAHIEELERQGIPAPPSVPTMYRIDPALIGHGGEIRVGSDKVSGEVEAVLLFQTDQLEDALVAVGSDFTDREEERRSIQRSKEQRKALSKAVWRYGEVAPRWDEIACRSWVERGANPPLYQSGRLASLLSPPDTLSRLGLSNASDLAGTVLFLGTVPLLGKEFAFTDYFACELETAEHKKISLECSLLRGNRKGNA